MQTSPQSACSPQTHWDARSRRAEDIAYQAVTIMAILLLLGSVWVF